MMSRASTPLPKGECRGRCAGILVARRRMTRGIRSAPAITAVDLQHRMRAASVRWSDVALAAWQGGSETLANAKSTGRQWAQGGRLDCPGAGVLVPHHQLALGLCLGAERGRAICPLSLLHRHHARCECRSAQPVNCRKLRRIALLDGRGRCAQRLQRLPGCASDGRGESTKSCEHRGQGGQSAAAGYQQ